MASSGSVSVSVTSWNTLKFNWWQVSQSVSNNNTVVGWNLQLVAGSSGQINSTASKDWSVTVNGTTYKGTNTVGINNNATKTLASGQTTITHNADGTKTFSFSFSQEFAITFSGSSVGTKSGSGSGGVNIIPRATQPTLSVSSVNMGAAVTISTPRASSSFTHDLAYAFAGGSYVNIETGVATSHSWTVPLSLASSIPKATSGTVTIRCITKNGSTTVGTKTVLLTAKVPASVVPTVSSVAVVEATAGLAAQFGALIQGKSTVKATITAAGAYGSTITAYSATYQGKTYTSSSFTTDAIKAAGSQSMTVKVKDSRGRWSAVTTKTFNALAYTAPKITAFKVYRTNADGTANENGVNAGVRYTYEVAALGNKNTASMKIEFKRSADAAYESGGVLVTGSSLSEDGTLTSSQTFPTDYQYDMRMTVTDWFGATSLYTAVLVSGAVIMDFAADGKGISFGKTADRSGADFGFSPKGAVLGLWEATANIPEGGNLDEYRQPGVYSTFSNAVVKTLLNCPSENAGTLRVWTGLGTAKTSGGYAYIMQEYHTYKANDPVYRRHLHSNAEGVFTASEWRPVTFRGQKVLWSGEYYMTAGQKAELSERVSEQDNGIVLVYSRYANGAVDNSNFKLEFVPKQFVKLLNGYGVNSIMGNSNLSLFATKYVYVNDDSIAGNAVNNQTATGTSGITYTNNAFVLRYVLGV